MRRGPASAMPVPGLAMLPRRSLCLAIALVLHAGPTHAVTAGGIVFGEPTPVNTRAASDGDHDDEKQRLAYDGRGSWVVVWPGESGADGLFGRDADVLFARSTDGQAWSPTAPITADGASDALDDQRPRLVSDGNGTLVALWDREVRQRFRLPAYFDPNVLVDFELRYRSVVVARSIDGGRTWSAPQRLNAEPAVERTPTPSYRFADGFSNVDVAADGHGTFLAIFTGKDAVYRARSGDGGVTWTSPPEKISPSVAFGRFEPDDTLVVSGTTAVLRTGDRLVRSIDGGRTWGTPTLLASHSIATDGHGTWMLIGLGGDRHVLMSRSVDDAATWSTPVVIEQGDEGGDDPSLATDGQSWVVVYEGNPGSRYTALIRSTDGGATWTAPARVSSGASPFKPKAAGDRAGHWLVVFKTRGVPGSSVDDFDLQAVFGVVADTPPPPVAAPAEGGQQVVGLPPPCASARCLFDAAVTALECSTGLPRALAAKLSRVVSLLDGARGATAKKARRLRKQARALLRQLGVAADRAAKATSGRRKKPGTLAPSCAGLIAQAVGTVSGSLDQL